MPRKRVIIDCDPGVDDAIAILLAFASSDELELLGITTVAGNVSLEATTGNALKICELAGRNDIPVYAGCPEPMFPLPPRPPSVHGHDGLGDVGIGSPTLKKVGKHAVDYIIEAIHRYPGEITLCPIGPMTNIALALVKDPSIAGKIKQIVFMGGAAFCPGNMDASAEFNIWFDPHAAQIMMSADIPSVMFGLDVTTKALITSNRMAAIRELGTEIAVKSTAMMMSYGSKDACLHDACVIAYLLDPSIFTGIRGRVQVDCVPGINRARTVVTTADSHLADQKPDCCVMTDVDSDRLFNLLTERLARL